MSDDIDRSELMEVVVVVNGPLGMTPAKAVGQAFQAAARGISEWTSVTIIPDEILLMQDVRQWIEQGTRTIVRVAKTPAIFQRVLDEVPGAIMRDEGFTEVEDGAETLFVSFPFLHKDRPKILNHKRLSDSFA